MSVEDQVITKDCNLIADQLTKISLTWQATLQIFEVPLDTVSMTLQQDKIFSVT